MFVIDIDLVRYRVFSVY